MKYKTILSKSKHSPYWFYSDYGANLYRGCNQNCIYCDSRSSVYGVENFDTVTPKEDAIQILTNELSRGKKQGIIATGAMSDPYNHLEKDLKLTHQLLQLCQRFQMGVLIITKSDLILEDLDLLIELNKQQKVVVVITITTFDDQLAKKIERNCISSTKRFEVVKQLRQAGIICGITLMPILPFINDTAENITKIVQKAVEIDASFIYPMFGVTLRDNQREHYFKYIDREFNLADKYKKLYQNNYMCNTYNKDLPTLFKSLCIDNDLIYQIEEINKLYNQDDKQLHFDF